MPVLLLLELQPEGGYDVSAGSFFSMLQSAIASSAIQLLLYIQIENLIAKMSKLPQGLRGANSRLCRKRSATTDRQARHPFMANSKLRKADKPVRYAGLLAECHGPASKASSERRLEVTRISFFKCSKKLFWQQPQDMSGIIFIGFA